MREEDNDREDMGREGNGRGERTIQRMKRRYKEVGKRGGEAREREGGGGKGEQSI